ncbi:hypothetical protein ACI3PL_22820, partial [Lacticaseibacillus paracasei]
RYKHPMIQLDPFKTMLVMSHSENTFDKKKMREPTVIKDSEGNEYKQENPFVKKTNMKIKDFIKDKKMRDFYATA